jgi:uncharacterized membrane protein
MLRSLLIGLVAGMRSMTPLAAVSAAARLHRLPGDDDAIRLLGADAVVATTGLLAVGELFGDKARWAPDRISPPGLLARTMTGVVAGGAVAAKEERGRAAAVGALGALVGGYVTFALRMRALGRYGQTKSGLVEDLIAVGATALLVGTSSPRASLPRTGRV